MILVMPQATASFNALLQDLEKNSLADTFLNRAFASYEMRNVEKVILILLENKFVTSYIENFLSSASYINEFEIIELKKETSGSICTTLMGISSISDNSVVISALDQIVIGDKLQLIDSLFDGDTEILAPIVNSDDPSLSYALSDDEQKVIQIFEKKMVSNDAILGVYFVRNFSKFHGQCHKLLIKYKGFKNRVFYTSDVINSYLADDMICKFPKIHSSLKKIRSLDDFKQIL